MINKPTVFVLGAGASVDYGFPLGEKLLEDIYNFLSIRKNFSTVRNLLCDLKYSKKEPDKFLKSFQESLDCTASIDDLIASLSKRDQIYSDAGKLCIAISLTNKEEESNLKPQKVKDKDGKEAYVFQEGWYKYLWNILYEDANGLEDLLKNKIKFITFNYDRSLQQYLYLKALGFFGRSKKETGDILKQIPIYHIYGKLGRLPWEEKESDSIEENDYKLLHFSLPDLKDKDKLTNIAKSLINYHEGQNDEDLTKNIRNAFLGAENIFFLGFGYHKQNIEVLRPTSDGPYGRVEYVSGTIFGLGDQQKERVIARVRDTMKIPANEHDLYDANICDFFKRQIKRIY